MGSNEAKWDQIQIKSKLTATPAAGHLVTSQFIFRWSLFTRFINFNFLLFCFLFWTKRLISSFQKYFLPFYHLTVVISDTFILGRFHIDCFRGCLCHSGRALPFVAFSERPMKEAHLNKIADPSNHRYEKAS